MLLAVGIKSSNKVPNQRGGPSLLGGFYTPGKWGLIGKHLVLRINNK
jgi:hypothetical protein